jgi:anti-sigma factor RsiW
MEISQNVILDLLPLYLAGEVSADTRSLIEKYLETDPELANIVARHSTAINLPEDIPVPLTKENQMEAYKDAKRYMFWRTVILAVVIALTLMGLIAFATLAFFLFSA